MGKLFEELSRDVRFIEGLNACMNCGVCTAVCPAAEYYNYDPRQILDIIQSQSEEKIEQLLRSETIWYCGECMSCRPRCPRANTPAYIIQALRALSQKLGYFTDSEKGRQQYALKRVIGGNILELGYCIHPTRIDPGLHPEQGPVWQWIYDNHKDLYARFSENYDKDGSGAMRRIDPESLEEIARIFEESGGKEFLDTIERHSRAKAEEMGMTIDEYFAHVYTANNGSHY